MFNHDFLWGGSLSSMQSEGAWNEDGKGLTTYDIKKINKHSSDWKNAIHAGRPGWWGRGW